MTIKVWIIGIIMLATLIFGGISGYTVRVASETTPQVHVTTQQVHVTTQTIDPNTLNQYCIYQYGNRSMGNSSDNTTFFYRDSLYIQCAATPLPGQERFQP